MLRYQGVIFDMDGVLCRTDRLHYRAWVRFTDKYGLSFSEELHETMLGLGREACMDTVLGEWGKRLTREEKDALILEKNDMFRELAQDLGPQDAAPGVRETLAVLRETDLRLAIGSSSQNAPFVIGKLQLAPFFDAWVDGTQMEHWKRRGGFPCRRMPAWWWTAACLGWRQPSGAGSHLPGSALPRRTHAARPVLPAFPIF